MSPDATTVDILLVEDEEELAGIYERWLAAHRVRTATTGAAAIQTLDDGFAPDIALLDRRLPDMAGTRVLHEIRDRGIDCRVAMITAVDPDFDILDLPFDDYLVKPVRRDDLLGVVDRLRSLASYDDRFQESYALAAKLTALEAEKPLQELDSNSDYQSSRERFEAVQREVSDALDDLGEEDFALLYRDLDDER